jgi:hypothetical protein
MNEKELYKLLQELNIPVGYDHFVAEDNITPPFILYRNDTADNFKADDKTYFKQHEYIIDLVTDKKDTVKERLLEDLLDTNNIPYDKEEDYIESEKIYQIRYFI